MAVPPTKLDPAPATVRLALAPERFLVPAQGFAMGANRFRRGQRSLERMPGMLEPR
jgi:hypothetical protein